jgi:glutamine amidotransferase
MRTAADVTIVDYGVGNLRSILRMFGRVGARAVIESDPNRISEATRLLLPGVGAFDAAMERLQAAGLEAPLRHASTVRRIPTLGVCLGMQLLGEGSEEGRLPGLAWIPGRCVRLPTESRSGESVRLPHMGWASVRARRPNALVTQNGPPRFYFVHSFAFRAAQENDILATAVHAEEFVAAVHRENVWGMQFHPEKSHLHGRTLLAAFARA